MSIIAVFNKISGLIDAKIKTSTEEYTPYCNESQDFIVYSIDFVRDDCYVNQGEITPRPTQSTTIDKTTIQANGVDLVQITGIPTDATFTAHNITTGDSVSGPVSGSDSFYSSIAGTIELTITKWPYLDWTATIEAV